MVEFGWTLHRHHDSLARFGDLRTSDLILNVFNDDIERVSRHGFWRNLNNVVLSALGASLVTLVDEDVKKVFRGALRKLPDHRIREMGSIIFAFRANF